MTRPEHAQHAAPPEMTGRADLHIHTRASDGIASIEEVLDWVELATDLDVIAICDHERCDGALAARSMAKARNLSFEVVVGEEVTTLGGHLLALWIEERIPRMKSLKWTIAAVHEQGGIAIPAHPLFPYPMCATAGTLRSLAADPDPRVRPDALETFNPTLFGRVHRQVVQFAGELGMPGLGNSDAHELSAIGRCWTNFEGSSAADVRAAIESGKLSPHGSFHSTAGQLPTFGRQLKKYRRDWTDELVGRFAKERYGRYLGYPGSERRPPRFDEAAFLSELGARDPGTRRRRAPVADR